MARVGAEVGHGRWLLGSEFGEKVVSLQVGGRSQGTHVCVESCCCDAWALGCFDLGPHSKRA